MLPGMTWLELQHKVMTSRPRQHRVTIDSQRAEQAHQAHQAQQAKQAQQAQHPYFIPCILIIFIVYKSVVYKIAS